jgi:hypothetical protein
MDRTRIDVSDALFEQARSKARREGLTVSEVIDDLLARWVAGEIKIRPGDRAHDRRVVLARAARGMWADRNPDAYLAASRAGLRARDEKPGHAGLDG